MCFAGAVFAFDGGHLQVGRGHFSLHEELAPGSADADQMGCGGELHFDERETGEVGLRGLELRGALHGSQRASPPWPWGHIPGRQRSHRRGGEKLERESCGEQGTRGRGTEGLRD